ncbi:unnamed protein product [Ilex paraguariensis]|uniref:Uncharacterized protein n=1 Tax=Ilex paraguariensis TaxID=185542 RepID=A0ABC8RUI2_9AQUA
MLIKESGMQVPTVIEKGEAIIDQRGSLREGGIGTGVEMPLGPYYCYCEPDEASQAILGATLGTELGSNLGATLGAKWGSLDATLGVELGSSPGATLGAKQGSLGASLGAELSHQAPKGKGPGKQRRARGMTSLDGEELGTLGQAFRGLGRPGTGH